MKHTLYAMTARPMTILGVPRIALICSVLLATVPYPILAFAIDQFVALIVCVSLFCILWIVMKIISLTDPDAILIIATKIRHLKALEGNDRYVA
ncbi:MAG: VirB3 family type IV secretion system protein [Helicobacteraceae bacterium]|jgi:type IV secretory pathway VirB3-like protein|nr:VirB3 family type IV secretion system protein [Helicobacteraceae bacterium]